MKEKKPAHRPTRHFPNATRIICQPEGKSCPYCKSRLKSTGSLYINKQVQTLTGPVNVRAYGYACYNPDCFATTARYHATRQLWKISLPNGTYGLDVIAHIGWQHDREHRQFLEIQHQLNKSGIIISSRHVGRLYRQYLALVASLNEQMINRLSESAKIHGGLIWSVDALQPDQDGTQLYVLYEVLSKTPVSAAWLNKRDYLHLLGWLEPISQLALPILATISDGEPALMKALKKLWSKCPHQMCHTHFLGDCAKPIREADRKLQQTLAGALSKLPPVPGSELSAHAGPKASTLPLKPPPNQITDDSDLASINACSLDQISPRTAGSQYSVDYIPSQSIDLPNPADQMPSQSPDSEYLLDQIPAVQSLDSEHSLDHMPAQSPDSEHSLDYMPVQSSDLAYLVDHIGLAEADSEHSPDTRAPESINLTDLADQIGVETLSCLDFAATSDTRTPVISNSNSDQLQDSTVQNQGSCKPSTMSQGSEPKRWPTNLDLKVEGYSNDQNRAEQKLKQNSDPQLNHDLREPCNSSQEEEITGSSPTTCGIVMAVAMTDELTTDEGLSDLGHTSWQADYSQSVDDWHHLESENVAYHFSDASKMVLLTIWCGANLSVLMNNYAQGVEADDQQASALSGLTINLSLAGTRAPLSLRQEIELRKMEIELSFRKSFQDVLRRASRYPSCFGGLDGHNQLSQIVAGLENSLSDHNGESYLHQLMRQGQIALDSTEMMIKDLQNARQKLQELTILLKVPDNQEQRDQLSAEEMKKKVNSLLAEIKKEEAGQITKAFVAECERLVNKWSESLFSCYDLSLLPANNARIESRFNDLRRGERRVSGRKKTSALRRYAHFQILLSASSIEELCALFSDVCFSTYQQARQSLYKAEEKERVRYRLRRWPYKTAQALAAEYETLCQVNLEDDPSTS